MKLKLTLLAILGALGFAGVAGAQEHFAGTGLELAVKHDLLTIIHVMTNTPASKAGLSPGLVVQTIDGVPTRDKPLKDCVEMIRGDAGTKVSLTLVDPVNRTTNTVELIREKIAIPGT